VTKLSYSCEHTLNHSQLPVQICPMKSVTLGKALKEICTIIKYGVTFLTSLYCKMRKWQKSEHQLLVYEMWGSYSTVGKVPNLLGYAAMLTGKYLVISDKPHLQGPNSYRRLLRPQIWTQKAPDSLITINQLTWCHISDAQTFRVLYYKSVKWMQHRRI
jgi:hypothetical protein